MQDIAIQNHETYAPKTELVRSYYDTFRDRSGDCFETIAARKDKIIKIYIAPLNKVIFQIEEDIMHVAGDKDFRCKMLEIEGKLIAAREMLIRHYQLEQTIK